jgi:hypothetical protein
MRSIGFGVTSSLMRTNCWCQPERVRSRQR